MDYSGMQREFTARFEKRPQRLFVAPARINLIGEHVDYNGGHVFPAAISLRSACMLRVREDNVVRLASTSREETVTAKTSELAGFGSLPWGGYQLGVLCLMQQAGWPVSGMDMLFDETVPHGGGLSASAAIELATATAVAGLSGRRPDMIALAQLCQRVENEYVGMNCGIMDQFASAMGKKGHAMLLNCDTQKYRYAPVALSEQDISLVIMNTNKPHALVHSAYNTRRAECEAALFDLQRRLNLGCLCALTPPEFEKNKLLIQDDICRRRAQHAVYENARTLLAFQALEAGDIARFGQLLIQSNDSLRELYEVTGPELDALTGAALATAGCWGARMMGGGFGGCAIALVESQRMAEFCDSVAAAYTAAIGYAPDFYGAELEDGAHEKTAWQPEK